VATESRSVLWVDGAAGSTITRINSDGGAASIQSAMLPCQNADFLQYWESDLTINGSPSPTVEEYQSVTQRAVLLFTTTAPGILVKLTLIAPKIGIFLSDGRTVDLSNADVSALAIACVGVLSTDSGDTATGLIAGYLQ
jgi:hypothetical protein